MVTALLAWIHQHYKVEQPLPVGVLFIFEMVTYIVIASLI